MALTPGDRLGPYEIQSALGAGGMGEVFRAKDTRLDRTVAIKVLAPALAANPDFRERFEREARAVSALDHPNICALYDVGREPSRGDGTAVDFLVMQFVAGETLAARISRGPLKIREVLRLATEIASALDRAHRSNIVHRDLKPGNVMLTTTGAKLLDFGLARIMAPAASAGMVSMPTIELTAEGTILGTFQYMAPEQLEGGEADARTDLFAFGALIYEAATGRKAFEGKSRASLIGSILRDDPLPISTVTGASRPPSTSSGATSTVMADADVLAAGLDRVVRRCLAKEPGDRWQTAADLLEALRWVSDGHAAERVPVAPPSRRPVLERVAWGTAIVIAAAVAAWGWLRPTPASSVTRFAFALPNGEVLGQNGVALSPDEKAIAASGSTAGTFVLYRRALDQLDPVPIRGTEGGQYPFFSPDGQWLGFFTQSGLKKVPAEGGPATLIAPSGTRLGASWGPDQTIVFASSGSPDLMVVPAAGGTPKVLVPAKSFGSGSLRWPAWSPDGRAVFLTIFNGGLGAAQIGVYVPETGASRVLLPGANPIVLAGGVLLFGRASSIWQVPFDTKTFTIGTAPPVPIAQGVQINTGGLVPAAALGNTLVYKPGSSGDSLTLAWSRRDGIRETLLATPQAYRAPRLSPDGERVAMFIVSDTEGTDREAAVWVYTIKTKALDKLTFGQGRYTDPVWTYDGRIIYAGSDTPDGVRNLYWTRADGAGVPERLATSTREQLPRSITRGGVLMYQERSVQGNWDLYTIPVSGDRKPVPFTQTPTLNEAAAAFSPDGQFVAYVSNETGQNEIFVRPLTGPGKWQVSQGGGNDPGWSTNGRELYYYAQQQLIAVSVQTSGSSFAMTAVPKSLFPLQRPAGYPTVVHPIDGRFLLLDRPEQDIPQIFVTQNAFNQAKH